MAAWQPGMRYKIILVCDQASTYYSIITMVQHGDIPEATEDNVRNATELLAETTLILADSLVENWSKYEAFESTNHKIMLGKMKDKLTEQKTVKIPSYGLLGKGGAPKLYTIDYSALYQSDPSGKQYIPDPFLVLIKAAVNLSAFSYATEGSNRDVRLLPTLSWSLDDETDESYCDLFDRPQEQRILSEAEMIGLEINVHGGTNNNNNNSEGEEQEKGEPDREDSTMSVVSDFTA
jgi:hypothetical protein